MYFFLNYFLYILIPLGLGNKQSTSCKTINNGNSIIQKLKSYYRLITFQGTKTNFLPPKSNHSINKYSHSLCNKNIIKPSSKGRMWSSTRQMWSKIREIILLWSVSLFCALLSVMFLYAGWIKNSGLLSFSIILDRKENLCT